jgi:hypothetical protein
VRGAELIEAAHPEVISGFGEQLLEHSDLAASS